VSNKYVNKSKNRIGIGKNFGISTSLVLVPNNSGYIFGIEQQ